MSGGSMDYLYRKVRDAALDSGDYAEGQERDPILAVLKNTGRADSSDGARQDRKQSEGE